MPLQTGAERVQNLADGLGQIKLNNQVLNGSGKLQVSANPALNQTDTIWVDSSNAAQPITYRLDNTRTLIEQKGVIGLFMTRGTPHTQGIIPVLEQLLRAARQAPSGSNLQPGGLVQVRGSVRMRMQAELAQREIDAGQQDPKALKQSLQHIAHSTERAAHMVNQLLAMARAEAKTLARPPEPVDLAALARETVRDFVPKAMDKRIDLGYEGPDDGQALHGTLMGQPTLVRELVRNLVDNALQYTPAGGTVTARVVDDPFGQVVVLQVEDTGPGIPEAERALVLQPFYRALGTNVDGSGLGLAIVNEIVQQHGAELAIADARPRGSAAAQGMGPGALFTVRFALSRPGDSQTGGVPAPAGG